ncbi:MAG: pitrilysin family protein, partial [Rubricoccaceae bacterium]|nr:pitrilysin family protein [Rubricoccaceae bacterium]
MPVTPPTSMDPDPQTAPPPSRLADRVTEAEAGAARLWLLPTTVRDVVAFRGSLETAPDLSTDDDLAQHLLVDLLDKGTRHRDRFAVAEALEGRGAELSFYPDGLRIGVAGKCLRDDLADVLALAAEQLREPLLDADEFRKEQARALAGVRQAMDSTGAQATGALKRRLYPSDHPNYNRPFDAELAALEALTVERVRAYHAEHVGGTALRIAVAGDLDPDAVAEAARAAFGDWAPHGRQASYAADAEASPPGRTDVPMDDKQNLDCRLGHALALRRDSDDFLPVYVGNFALGGNFSARLMQEVRDRQGLTYGIGSAVSGVTVEHGGHWRISVGLSRENLERGLDATRAEVRRFVEEGLRPDELAEKQETIAGTHVVGLATTTGLAARLLVNAERGFPVAYLDEYPERVRALTVEAVNAAVRRHLDPERLHLAVAGTLP